MWELANPAKFVNMSPDEITKRLRCLKYLAEQDSVGSPSKADVLIRNLLQAASSYVAAGRDFQDQTPSGFLNFWSQHDAPSSSFKTWADVAERAALAMPSEACVERVFAVASTMLRSEQHRQVQDAAAATAMLKYNGREPWMGRKFNIEAPGHFARALPPFPPLLSAAPAPVPPAAAVSLPSASHLPAAAVAAPSRRSGRRRRHTLPALANAPAAAAVPKNNWKQCCLCSSWRLVEVDDDDHKDAANENFDCECMRMKCTDQCCYCEEEGIEECDCDAAKAQRGSQ